MGPVTLQSNQIVEPDHIRKILLLQRVQGWSYLRLLRAKAMIVWTFVIILRHCETRHMDLCDVSQVDDGSIARVRKAKNDLLESASVIPPGKMAGDWSQRERRTGHRKRG